MTELDLTIPGDVVTLIAAYGQPVTLELRSNVYDPATRRAGVEAPTLVQTKMTPPEPYETKYVNGDTILTTDLWALLPANIAEPAPQHSTVVLNDGRRLQVEAADKIMSGELVAAWMVQLRG